MQVQSVSFDEKSNSVNNVDFSKELNLAYLASPGPVSVRLALEGYKFNTKNQGFRLSYLLQVDFTNKLPPSSVSAPISFELLYSDPLATLKTVG